MVLAPVLEETRPPRAVAEDLDLGGLERGVGDVGQTRACICHLRQIVDIVNTQGKTIDRHNCRVRC